MAQPLTSTDIIRERMGFGVSPMASEDTRRAYAAAGLSPLGTQERQRFEAGGGLSPMASKQEQEAWKQAEFMAGRREQAPVSYGGLGDRPTVTAPARFDEKGEPIGSYRRQLRMQEMWDAQQKQAFEMDKVARQMSLQERQASLDERNTIIAEDREARLQAAEAKKQEEEFKNSQEANAAMVEIMGGVDPQGNEISPLNPDDPKYMQRRNEIIKRYPRAVYDDGFKTAISTTDKTHFDLLNFRQQQQLQEESSGRLIERQIAAETRAAEKQAGIRKEEKEAAKEDVLVSQEREIDKQIRAQRQVLAGLQGQKPTRTLEKAATEASNKLLDLRIERAGLRGLAFEDQDAYKQAVDAGKKPPSGTTIYIGRKQVKVK